MVDKHFGKHDIEMFKERLIKYKLDDVSFEAVKDDFRKFYGDSIETESKLSEIISMI